MALSVNVGKTPHLKPPFDYESQNKVRAEEELKLSQHQMQHKCSCKEAFSARKPSLQTQITEFHFQSVIKIIIRKISL